MDSYNGTWGFPRWVSPFRDLRITGYLLLPEAFRSLSRLSSALSAKASTLCPYQLDHLLSCFRSTRRCIALHLLAFRLPDSGLPATGLLQLFFCCSFLQPSDVLNIWFHILNIDFSMRFSRYVRRKTFGTAHQSDDPFPPLSRDWRWRDSNS